MDLSKYVLINIKKEKENPFIPFAEEKIINLCTEIKMDILS